MKTIGKQLVLGVCTTEIKYSTSNHHSPYFLGLNLSERTILGNSQGPSRNISQRFLRKRSSKKEKKCHRMVNCWISWRNKNKCIHRDCIWCWELSSSWSSRSLVSNYYQPNCDLLFFIIYALMFRSFRIANVRHSQISI